MSIGNRSPRRWIIAGLILFELAVLGGIVASVGGVWPGRWWSWGWPFSAGWSGGWTRESFTEQVPVSGGRARVRVINSLGRVEVTGSPESTTVQVQGEKRARGASRERAEEALQQVDVDIRNDRGTIVVKVERPWGGWPFLHFLAGHATVDLALTVPAQSDVRVDADLGDVTVSGVTGELELSSDMGTIRASDIGGDLTAHANMGKIEVFGAELADQMEINADMGSIEFEGLPARRSVLSSNMGSIQIGLPAGRSFDIDARVSMGSVDIGLPFSGVREGQRARGTLGTGTPAGSLELRSNMGSIEIEEVR